jgi:2-C-methyl-D-erythritol 4-phosphate cytidylyltransferase
MSMKDYVIIVAGGSGSRMNSTLPKQFMDLNGRPIICHTIERFYQYNPEIEIVVVLSGEYLQFWDDLRRTIQFTIPHQLVSGGGERFFSVKNGLAAIDNANVIGIHDAVRPLVSTRTIERCYHTAAERTTAIPVITINDTLREVKSGMSKTVDRNHFRIVQTPQCFDAKLLSDAFAQDYIPAFTDDATVVEFFGEKINLVEGNKENIKITTPEDLDMAHALLSLKNP